MEAYSQSLRPFLFKMKIDKNLLKIIEEEGLNVYVTWDNKTFLGYENGKKEFPQFWRKRKEYIATIECSDERPGFPKITPLHPANSEYQARINSLVRKIFPPERPKK